LAAWVVKLSASGSLEWQTTWPPEPYYGSFYAVTEGPNGYVAVGETFAGGLNFSDIIAVKTNLQGESQWLRVYNLGGDTDLAMSVKPAPNGGYFVAGGSFEAVNTRPIVLELSEGGDLQWAYAIGESAWPDSNTFWALDTTADGGLVLAGETRSLAPPGNGYDGWLVRTDGEAQITWQNAYGRAEEQGLYAVTETDDDMDGQRDDGFVAAGVAAPYYDSWEADYNAFIVKTNATGIVVDCAPQATAAARSPFEPALVPRGAETTSAPGTTGSGSAVMETTDAPREDLCLEQGDGAGLRSEGGTDTPYNPLWWRFTRRFFGPGKPQ
jgi:hypothetical protein